MKLRILLAITLLTPAAWAWIEIMRKHKENEVPEHQNTELYEVPEEELFI